MNYQKIYTQLIERALKRTLIGYKENHHIIPKCLGGSNDNNIVALTAREHYIAHWLLVRIYPQNNKLIYAFWRMSTVMKDRKVTVSSRSYQEARELVSQIVSKNNKLRKTSPETRLKLSVSLKGKNKGKSFKQSLETCEKKRQSRLGVKHSQETCVKMSNSMKGKNRISKTEAQKLALSKGKILAYKDEKFIGEFPNAVIAAQSLNIYNNISKVLCGRRPHCNGYTFTRL